MQTGNVAELRNSFHAFSREHIAALQLTVLMLLQQESRIEGRKLQARSFSYGEAFGLRDLQREITHLGGQGAGVPCQSG